MIALTSGFSNHNQTCSIYTNMKGACLYFQLQRPIPGISSSVLAKYIASLLLSFFISLTVELTIIICTESFLKPDILLNYSVK